MRAIVPDYDDGDLGEPKARAARGVRRLHVDSAESLSTVGQDPLSDPSLRDRVADLVVRASENVTEPEQSMAEIRALVARRLSGSEPTAS